MQKGQTIERGEKFDLQEFQKESKGEWIERKMSKNNEHFLELRPQSP